jgi:hypothetical protein
MYTAGGPEALLDGITGTTNWRSGEWQSYFNNNFEAIIDLQKDIQVNYIAIHTLQDVGSWIVYPKEVIVDVSNDGKNYTEAFRISNTVSVEGTKLSMQESGKEVNYKIRYVRIKAVNGGILPEWHESAGNPSHLFIDEVIIK